MNSCGVISQGGVTIVASFNRLLLYIVLIFVVTLQMNDAFPCCLRNINCSEVLARKKAFLFPIRTCLSLWFYPLLIYLLAALIGMDNSEAAPPPPPPRPSAAASPPRASGRRRPRPPYKPVSVPAEASPQVFSDYFIFAPGEGPHAGDGALVDRSLASLPSSPNPRVIFRWPECAPGEDPNATACGVKATMLASFCFLDEEKADRRGVDRHVAQFFTFAITLVDGARVYAFCLKCLSEGVGRRYDVGLRRTEVHCLLSMEPLFDLARYILGCMRVRRLVDPRAVEPFLKALRDVCAPRRTFYC